MDKIKKLAIIFCLAFAIMGCNKFDKKNDNITFRVQSWLEVDLNNRSIYCDLTKELFKLNLTQGEEYAIIKSFDENNIADLKGEYHVSGPSLTTPIVPLMFTVKRNGKSVLNVSINQGYKTVPNSKAVDDRLSAFMDDIKKILKNNSSYIGAEKQLDDFIKREGVFSL